MSRRKKMKKSQIIESAIATSLCPETASRKEKIAAIKSMGVKVHPKAPKERFEKAMETARNVADSLIEREYALKKQSNRRKRARKSIQKSAA